MAQYLKTGVQSLTISSLVLLGMGLFSVSPTLSQGLVDPTKPPPSFGAGETATPGDQASQAGPVLQSVLLSASRKEAIISGKLVKVGDAVGEAKVVRISESEVVLRKGGELQTLKLFPGVHKRVDSNRTNAAPSARQQ